MLFQLNFNVHRGIKCKYMKDTRLQGKEDHCHTAVHCLECTSNIKLLTSKNSPPLLSFQWTWELKQTHENADDNLAGAENNIQEWYSSIDLCTIEHTQTFLVSVLTCLKCICLIYHHFSRASSPFKMWANVKRSYSLWKFPTFWAEVSVCSHNCDRNKKGRKPFYTSIKAELHGKCC